MKLTNRLVNLKIADKLKAYRKCMLALIIGLGTISILLTIFMLTEIRQITEVWSPSLSYVQGLNTLVSDYRLKQYGHLVATDADTIASYEKELEDVDQQMQEAIQSFESVISTEVEKQEFDNAQEKWAEYKKQSEEVLELSREGKTEEAGIMMVGDIYTTYKEFNQNFTNLIEYENNELQSAKNTVYIVFVIIIVVIVAVIIFAVVVATSIGVTIGKMISEPMEKIEEAIISMRDGDFSKSDILTYESEDEMGVVSTKLKEALINLSAYVTEISDELRKMAAGDLTRNGDDITNFLGEFASIKESFVFILKRFNSTLTEIQNTSGFVASDAEQIANASQSLAEGASDQASAVEELTATVETVASLATESAKATQSAYEEIKAAADKAEIEKQKMEELTVEMQHITDISKEIEKIIQAIEDIASQTNLLSLNASIEAARAGDAGKGFAVVADQIGKLASDSAQSAVTTRDLINKTMVEIEKGNAITISTSESFEQIIDEMKNFADIAQQTTETANTQASALKQIDMGIEQISGTIQNTAASSEENSAISANLSEKSQQLDALVKRFKLF